MALHFPILHHKLSTLLLLAFTVPLLGSCEYTQPNAKADESPPEITVKLSSVRSGITNESSEFIANLESRHSVALQPRIEGQISRIFVRAGDKVSKGEAIIQIDPAKQRASVDSFLAATQTTQADMQNAKATLASLKAQRLSRISEMKFNQLQYQRYTDLYAQGAVAQQMQDQYANSLEAARSGFQAIEQQIQAQQAMVIKAEKALQQARANLKQEQIQLQYFTITVPFSGKVGSIPVKVGDFVNTSTVLTTITEDQLLEINISVPIHQAPQLRIGMPVEILDAQNRSIGTSQIFFISPSVTSDAQTVLIKAQLRNPKRQLQANQFVKARVIWGVRSGVFIPATAVSRQAGKEFVYVAQKQGQSKLVAQQRIVKLGSIRGNDYHVIEGLKPEDKVVISGILNLSDGVTITPES